MFQPVVNLFHPLCFFSNQLIHAPVITFNDTAPVMLMNLLHKNQFQTKDKQTQLFTINTEEPVH